MKPICSANVLHRIQHLPSDIDHSLLEVKLLNRAVLRLVKHVLSDPAGLRTTGQIQRISWRSRRRGRKGTRETKETRSGNTCTSYGDVGEVQILARDVVRHISRDVVHFSQDVVEVLHVTRSVDDSLVYRQDASSVTASQSNSGSTSAACPHTLACPLVPKNSDVSWSYQSRSWKQMISTFFIRPISIFEKSDIRETERDIYPSSNYVILSELKK